MSNAINGTVTKSELIERISEKLKLPNGKAEQIVNCVFDSMVKALQEGEGIEIRGFGSFTVREYKAYEGRNPRTGETVHVAPKKLPFFKVGKDLRERVNSAFANRPEGSFEAIGDDDDGNDDDGGTSDSAPPPSAESRRDAASGREACARAIDSCHASAGARRARGRGRPHRRGKEAIGEHAARVRRSRGPGECARFKARRATRSQ